MSAHPRDEWIEVWVMGESEPIWFLVADGREVEIAEAKALYTADRLTVGELERRVEVALRA